MPKRKNAKPVAPVQRHTYTREEAAESLGMSLQHFERKVQPHIKVVPCGQLLLIPPEEIGRWVRANARHLLPQPD